jgi:cyclic pyranopterin phosphate synthase
MPEDDYVWLPREDRLRFEEIDRLVRLFVQLGVDKVRITGGEPLLRRELYKLVAMIARYDGLRELAMTTNGVLLADHAASLREAGLKRITVSLDTLDRQTFQMLARRDDLDRVLTGVQAAREAGFTGLKLDTVVIAGVNDHELADLVDYARSQEAEIRFIEYMDVGGATRWRPESVVSRARMLQLIEQRLGRITPIPRTDSAPAERFELRDGTTFGIISSVTQPFCSKCDRSRRTDLRSALRSDQSDAQLTAMIAGLWEQRDDRGAELRRIERNRSALAEAEDLRHNPHLEMHTRGG